MTTITGKQISESFEATAGRVHPVIILPPSTMSKEDLQRLRDNGFCVVEAEKPELVKFLDPIPAVADRTAIENAAILLSRKIMSPSFWQGTETRKTIISTYFDILIKGTPLDPELSKRQENEQQIFDAAKYEELRRLAREEAKAERAAAKAAKQKDAEKDKS